MHRTATGQVAECEQIVFFGLCYKPGRANRGEREVKSRVSNRMFVSGGSQERCWWSATVSSLRHLVREFWDPIQSPRIIFAQ